MLFILPATSRADRLVLRNLDIIRDKKIVAMNFDGVKLDDGQVISWDAIESGRLDGGRQELFDKYLKNLGIHLYRIRQRLSVGDYRTLGPHAEAVAKYYRGRNSETAYMVMQALMWSRLAQGQREAAVAPYWRCFEYLRTRQGQPVNLPGERRLKYDPATGMCPELAPVWFDEEAAKAALPEVARAIGDMNSPRPGGTRIYYASLAVAAGDEAAAGRALSGIDEGNTVLAQLRDLVGVQRELAAGTPGDKMRWLETSIDRIQPANKPLALYWLGLAKTRDDQPAAKKQGLLHLLSLPAAYGQKQPELAAAGLYQSMKTLEALGDAKGSVAVRGELLDKYAQTYFGAEVASPNR